MYSPSYIGCFLFNLNYVAQNAPARGSGSASEAGHEPARRAHVGARGADHGGLLGGGVPATVGGFGWWVTNSPSPAPAEARLPQ